MSGRTTREAQLAAWPRLGTFPTTPAFVAAVIGLDYLTFAAWLLLTVVLLLRAGDAAELQAAVLTARQAIPDGWLLFLTGLHAGGITQFGIKRKTYRPDVDTASAPPADATP